MGSVPADATSSSPSDRYIVAGAAALSEEGSGHIPGNGSSHPESPHS